MYLFHDYLEAFVDIIPDCWTKQDGDLPSWTNWFRSWRLGITDGFLNNGFTGAYKINLWQAAKSDWILSPQFDLTGGPFQVDFDFGLCNLVVILMQELLDLMIGRIMLI